MKLTFHGGAGSVTGANYLLESGKRKILIDCGLRQGGSFANKENFDAFPYDPKSIEAVFITHAHIDHIGRLPKLFHDGFRGTVYSTPPTKDFAELLLLDSEHLLGKEAEHQGLPPLYTVDDVRKVMDHWKTAPYHETIDVNNFKVQFFDAGHILGSAIVRIEAEGKVIVFSGDLGNYPAPIIRATEFLDHADYCLVESTYGNRVHEDSSKRREFLEDAIEDTVRNGGVLLIPAFAMERTQELVYQLNSLIEEGRVPKVPIFIDSPLAIRLTEVYKKYTDYFNDETRATVHGGDDILNFPGLRFTLTSEQSKEINTAPAPKVIIAGSGMSHGGRILHHEMRYLSDPKNMLLFVGYQAKGSMGRQLLEGQKIVRIMGVEIPVRIQTRMVTSYSAHADQPKLLQWLAPMKGSLKKVFVVQGEDEESAALAEKIRSDLGLEAIIPIDEQSVEL